MRLLLLALALTLLAEENSRTPIRNPRPLLRVTAPEADPPLDPQSLSARIDGQPARVLRSLGPSDDLVILLVLDLSGEPTLIDTARAALREHIPSLPPNAWVGLLRSQDNLAVLLDPTPDRERLLRAIDEYPATGKAGLLPSLEPVASLANRLLDRGPVRVAIFYVTDSNIYNYREDYTNPVINSTDSRDLSRRFPDQLIREQMQKLSDRLSLFESPIYILHLNVFPDVINEGYRRGLLQITEESGGLGVFCRSRAEISSETARLLSTLRSHWSVTVEFKRQRQRVVNVDLFSGDRDIPNRARFAVGRR
jgi:hypothetical protein